MSAENAKEGPSIGSKIFVGMSIAVLSAVFGYFVSYFDGIRKDRIAFTNEQIEKLYGPLHGLAEANDATWTQFVASGRAPDWNNPSKEEITSWRVWMQNVLQPMNVQIEQIMVANPRLILGDKFPSVFQEIIAHTEAYKALISTWKQDDIADINTYTSKSANTVALAYPANLDRCVGPIFTALKKRQEALQTYNIFKAFSLMPVSIPPECDEELPRSLP
jgi:hypothetical protein